jgi:uncharacterized protein with FMN-binding domain
MLQHMKKFTVSSLLLVLFGAYTMYWRMTNAVTPLPPSVPLAATSSLSDSSSSDAGSSAAPVAVVPVDTPPPPVVPQPNANDVPPPPVIASSSSDAPPPASVPVTAPPAPAPAPVPQGQYKDGEYTGISADAYYGNVQVKVVVQGGKISDVQFLDHPGDRGHSIQINNYAMPLLTQEAIQTQSAPVDTVSGASATSGAFNQSLASALDQAKL